VNSDNLDVFLINELPLFLKDVELHARQRMWIQLGGAVLHYALKYALSWQVDWQMWTHTIASEVAWFDAA